MDELDHLAAELRSQLGPAPVPSDAQWRRLKQDERLAPRRGSERRPWLWGVALGFVVLLSWGVATRVPFGASPRELAAAAAPFESRLNDGTVVVLDRDSHGRLEEGGDETSFRLDAGRVTLDVAPQHGRSFVVRAASYTVTVVGTRFDVRLGATGGVVVEVAHGVVLVQPPGGSSEVRLGQGDRLEGDADGRVTVRRASTVANAIPNAGEASQRPEIVAAPPPRPIEAKAVEASAAPSLAVHNSAANWRSLFQERRYSEALNAARALGLARLQNQLDAGALSDLADTARLAGDANLGVGVLRTVRARFPGSVQASRAAFLLGRAYALSGKQKDAISAFEAHLTEDASGLHSTEALGRLMELYVAVGDRTRARGTAERYLERAPNGPYERLARSLVAP